MADFHVTGAGGFIGQALCRKLVGGGHRVIKYGRADLLSMKPVSGGICFHLAGESVPSEAEKNFERSFQEALAIGAHVLSRGFQMAVFASSAWVYGLKRAEPHRESGPLDLSSAYAKIKRAVEEKFLEKGQCVVRIANSFGPGMKSHNNIFSDILKQIPGSGPLQMRDTAALRDYIYIDDLLEGIIQVAMGNQRGIFNLGTGIGTSAGDLARKILELRQEGGREIVSMTAKKELSCLVLDPTKMRDAFGWKPSVSLDEGLERWMSDKAEKR